MFHQADLHWGAAEGSAPLCARDLVNAGRDAGVGAEVGADKYHPRARSSRLKTKSNLGARQKAHTLDVGGPGESPLVAVTVPVHVRVFLDSGKGR
jgi:hypothetical protein